MVVFRRYLPAGLILTAGLGLTLAATTWVSRWERLSRQGEFQKQINNLTTSLQRTTNRYNELLLAISDLYAANGNEVTEQSFSQFVQRAVGTYPGIQALEWAPLISQAQRQDYEQELQTKTGLNQITITERQGDGELIPATQRNSYVPVTFVEPWQTNEAALGYDLASDVTRRTALERARDTGNLAATGRIQLVQDAADNQYGFLVFVPVYRQPAQSLASRRQQLQGYILGVFRVADVVEESLADLDYEIDFYIVDQTARADQQLLGFYDAGQQQVISRGGAAGPGAKTDDPEQGPTRSNGLCPSGLDCTQTLSLGQRQWQLLVLPPRYTLLPWTALATLLLGLLITTTLLVYLSRWQTELRRTRELSDLKLRLFSMASHELRTPLSVISVSAQSLDAHQHHLTPQQQATTVERIQAAAKRMGQLVNDILTLTRAEAGKLEVNPEILELEPFCRQVFEQIQLQPGQRLQLEGNAAHQKAYLDRALLQSVLTNLLSNAAKYSPPDSPIRLVVTTATNTLQFQVIDQGIGIPAAAQPRIFEAFYRAGNVGQIQGTGLGLAVAKTCVEIQAGHLTISSEPGQGTCVAALFPRIE
jgi:signal transduction histidine kinase